MYSADSANAVDFWGRFPKICPNDSNYSIQLGNDGVGGEAAAISYTFTIPAGQPTLTLVLNYRIAAIFLITVKTVLFSSETVADLNNSAV